MCWIADRIINGYYKTEHIGSDETKTVSLLFFCVGGGADLYGILVVILLSYGFYTLAGEFIIFPSKKTEKVISGFRQKKRITERCYTILIYPMIKLIAKFIHMEHYEEIKLSGKLQRAGIALKPAEYKAKAFVTAGLTILGSLLFIPLGLTVVTLCMMLLGVMLFFRERQSVDEKLKKINRKILDELPRFVRTYSNSLKSSKDILGFMERYCKIAGANFKYDLDILITELKTGNMEEALRRFDERVNIPQLSTFISGVIGTSKGIDQQTFFYLMEQDMKVLARENIKREIAKRPGKMKVATVAVGVMMFLLYLYPIVLDLKNGLGIFQ